MTMPVVPDIELKLNLEPAPKGTVYLSVSWQPDKGKDFGYRVIRRLDEAGYLVIGDTKGYDEMDPEEDRANYGPGGRLSFCAPLPTG